MPGVAEGALYKYLIETADGKLLYKADPYAFSAEVRPGTASRVADIENYPWKDGAWMRRRAGTDHFKRPLNIYEVHLGSWKQHDVPRDNPEDVPVAAFYNYRETADELVPYVKEMGYSHIELMPVMEHPFDGSWGYQVTGYYAATSRYGQPKDLMYLIEKCHKAGIGVILDWVPGHFCRDEFGLGRFNGEKLYEDQDHVHWGTYTFDFGRPEVRSFLLSNAHFWLEKYHADGIRVDGVTSMLYLNFGIDDPGQKKFNKYGTEEDLDASAFIRQVNCAVEAHYPDVMMMAEESTAWPLVTYPPQDGGLGFHYKWDMGWMNDTLHYMQTDFPWRPGNHGLLTFSIMYAFTENFICPLSHDEVVHGKCSLIGRMPGDWWRQFAGLRTLAFYQMTHPGAKLNFMGNEMAHFREWDEKRPLDWDLLNYPFHDSFQKFFAAVSRLYATEPALYDGEYNPDCFEWVACESRAEGVYAWLRKGAGQNLLCVMNTQNTAHKKFPLYLKFPCGAEELLNTEASVWGGADKSRTKTFHTTDGGVYGRDYTLAIDLPAMGSRLFRLSPEALHPEAAQASAALALNQKRKAARAAKAPANKSKK